jgi:hypothetical protein
MQPPLRERVQRHSELHRRVCGGTAVLKQRRNHMTVLGESSLRPGRL